MTEAIDCDLAWKKSDQNWTPAHVVCYAFYCSLKIFVAGNSNCKHILVDTVHSWVSGATVAWANHFQITLSINNDWMEKSKFSDFVFQNQFQ